MMLNKGSEHREQWAAPQLPEIDDSAVPAGHLVRRAVMTAVLAFSGLLFAGAIALWTVTVPVVVNGLGTLEPVKVWPVYAPTSGSVTDLLMQTGDTVVKGEALLRIDTVSTASVLRQLEADSSAQQLEELRFKHAGGLTRLEGDAAIVQAEAHLLRARAELRTLMVEQGLGMNVDSLLLAYPRGTQVALDLAVAGVESAVAERLLAGAHAAKAAIAAIEEARQSIARRKVASQLAAQRELVARSVLKAPTTGVLLTNEVERLRGRLVRAGELILEVAETRDWTAVVSIQQSDVHRLHRGDSATVEIPALLAMREEPFRASVLSIAVGPHVSAFADGETRASGASSVFRVVLSIERAQLDSLGPELFRSGYAVRASIVTRRSRAWALLRERLLRKK